jgi:hypothetical protein
LRNFQDEENRTESDGNASDDEADSNEVDEQSKQKLKPTLEEYVKKHVFNRSKFNLLLVLNVKTFVNI